MRSPSLALFIEHIALVEADIEAIGVHIASVTEAEDKVASNQELAVMFRVQDDYGKLLAMLKAAA